MNIPVIIPQTLHFHLTYHWKIVYPFQPLFTVTITVMRLQTCHNQNNLNFHPRILSQFQSLTPVTISVMIYCDYRLPSHLQCHRVGLSPFYPLTFLLRKKLHLWVCSSALHHQIFLFWWLHSNQTQAHKCFLVLFRIFFPSKTSSISSYSSNAISCLT